MQSQLDTSPHPRSKGRSRRPDESIHDPAATVSPGPPDWQAEVTRSSAANAVLGLWIAASPWALRFRDGDLIALSPVLGGAIAVLAAARTLRPESDALLSWMTAALGASLSVLAVLLADARVAMWHGGVVGVLVAVLAMWSASARPRK